MSLAEVCSKLVLFELDEEDAAQVFSDNIFYSHKRKDIKDENYVVGLSHVRLID